MTDGKAARWWRGFPRRGAIRRESLNAVGLTIHLLGRPRIESTSGVSYEFRSRKSWALLAFILMSRHPPPRSQLASLLFGEANDPLRALRWNLAEIRRSLGDYGSIEGDPVVLRLSTDCIVDVDVVMKGSWTEAVRLDGLGADLLDGIFIQAAPAFESWLLSEQRHLAAASESILHEAALSSMSRGDEQLAVSYAVRAAVMNPLDENHQALLIRLYRLTADDVGAERQFAVCTELLHRELGTEPGPAVHAAMSERSRRQATVADRASVAAVMEAGSAAVAAGAVEAGIQSLRTAVRLADSLSLEDLRSGSRLALAESLVHSLRGFNEEGIAVLHEAVEIADASDDMAAVAQARAELGHVDFLRARYHRARAALTDALQLSDTSPLTEAKALTYLGSVESDCANYPRAIELLEQATKTARAAADPVRESYSLSMLGRVSLLRNDLDTASRQLEESIIIAEREHWLAILPWPQSLRGEVQLANNDLAGAEDLLRQAFARACQIGDPCWEGISARGLALVAEASDLPSRAFELLSDARNRCNRLPDRYVWLDGYILDAQCRLGLRHSHPDTGVWVDRLRRLSSRTAMRELTVRSLLYGAALGHPDDAAAAAVLGAQIDNPALQALLNV